LQSDVHRDLSASAAAFINAVWPAIADRCGGGEIVPVESVTAQGFARDLDTLSGIDAWQIIRHRHVIRGIASRIQWTDGPWRTFTIRRSRSTGAATEYEKRREAIANAEMGALYPTLTVQAYFDQRTDARLLRAAVALTRDVFDCIEQGYATTEINPDGNTFYAVPWAVLIATHCKILIVEGSET
jgi:hypothetical protein